MVSEVMNVMSAHLGFTANATTPGRMPPFILLPDGTVGGLGGYLVRKGEADLLSVGITHTRERDRVLDFSIPLYHVGTTVPHQKWAKGEGGRGGGRDSKMGQVSLI